MLHISLGRAKISTRTKASDRLVAQPFVPRAQLPPATSRHDQIVRLAEEPIAAEVEQSLQGVSVRLVIRRQHIAGFGFRRGFAQPPQQFRVRLHLGQPREVRRQPRG
jgi:hypothetical protein